MKSVNDFFNNFRDDINRINICKIGKVVKFYPEKNKADVLPLPSEENAIVLNVPVAHVRSRDFFIYNPLKEGDKVILIFADNDTDSLLLNEDKAGTERCHDISDCICVGGLTLLTEDLKLADKDSLCLQNSDASGSIVIKKNGDIEIKASHFSVKAERIDLN